MFDRFDAPVQRRGATGVVLFLEYGEDCHHAKFPSAAVRVEPLSATSTHHAPQVGHRSGTDAISQIDVHSRFYPRKGMSMSRDQLASRPLGWAFLPALLLALLPAGVAAQEPVTITGKVTSASGEALRDVNVTVAEFGVGGWTGADGTYRLSVPGARAQGQQVKMNARLIGFRAGSATITVTAGATVQQNFQLASDPLRLDVVVVTGAGTQERRERLATATATVDSGTISRTNEQNVIQALAGKLPNVLTNQASGDAGASTAIQIRGPKTFGTSQPTIIVDGVPISNVTRAENGQVNAPLSGAPSPNRAADLNLDDYESAEVLMGAAATSIYGASAGSAGAILLTSKRGRPGRTQYTLRSTMQFDRPVRTLPVQRKYGVGSGGVSTS